MSNPEGEHDPNRPKIKEYEFKPKKDITSYELAKIFETANLTVNEHLLQTFEPRVRRHFK